MESTSAAQAVEALLRAYGKLVFHTIYGLTGDWEERQDLMQETFLSPGAIGLSPGFVRLPEPTNCACGAHFRRAYHDIP